MLIFMFKTFFFSWADKIDTKFCLKSTLVSWLNLELFYANNGIVFSFTISKIPLVKTKSINKKKKHAKKKRNKGNRYSVGLIVKMEITFGSCLSQ